MQMTQEPKRLPVGGAYAIAILALIVSLAGGAYAAFKLDKNSVKSKQIKDGQVMTNDLANGSVNSDKLANSSVNSDKVAGGSIGSDKLANGSVDSDKLANGSVTGDKLAADSVTSDKVGPDALTGADIATLGSGDIGELSGANLPIRWAFVDTDGTIKAQSGGITLGNKPSQGVYRINFGTSLSNYAVIGSLWTPGEISTGYCGVSSGFGPGTDCSPTSPGSNTTSVADIGTYNDAGSPANRAFYVVAIP
jgi:hypothetical protein